jgi:hypothetical protein
VKASLPRIIRCLLLAVISCSCVAQEKQTRRPPKEPRPVEVVVAETSPVELASAGGVSQAVQVPPAVQPLKPPSGKSDGIEPIPLWRGQGMLMPIPPAEGPPNIVLVPNVRPKRAH